MTTEELAAAYALTGFGDSGVQRNAVFHKGMTPNESWNAMQVSDWLDEQLDTYMYSVEEILSRASVKLAQLKEGDSAGYRKFSDDNPKYKGMIDCFVHISREQGDPLLASLGGLALPSLVHSVCFGFCS